MNPSENYHDAVLRKEGSQRVNYHKEESNDDDEEEDDENTAEASNQIVRYRTWYESWFRHEFKPYWFAGILILSLFFERFWFIVTVYKTKAHGYVLILIVSFLNSMFALFTSMIKKKKHKRKLYEYFQLYKTPKVGVCIFGLVSILDMFYVFFLFWAANDVPAGTLITLLQLYIPLNMIVRRLFLSQSHYLPHWIAGWVILAGWGVAYIRVIYFTTVDKTKEETNTLLYALFLPLSTLLEVISLGIKEGLVRSQPINNEKFNFKISLGQFLIGIAITPIIVSIYVNNESQKESGFTGNVWTDMTKYVSDGFTCVTSFNNTSQTFLGNWNFSLIYILGYTVSTFLYQIILKALLERKRFSIIRKVFALIIPLTVLAFLAGSLSISPQEYHGGFEWLDVVSVLIAFGGVLAYNSFDEKPAKIFIEK